MPNPTNPTHRLAEPAPNATYASIPGDHGKIRCQICKSEWAVLQRRGKYLYYECRRCKTRYKA